VFVAGKDLQELWLDELGKGDSIYESIFSYEKYLRCMWTETDEICERLVDWTRPGSNDVIEMVKLNCTNCGQPALLKDEICQRCGMSLSKTETCTSAVPGFKSYLSFKGRGIPRRIIRAFNEHVLWEDGIPRLGFTHEDSRRIRFYAGLENVLRQSYITLFGSVLDESHGAYEDKRRLGVLHLIDWVLRQPKSKFTVQDAASAAKAPKPEDSFS
jgi:hypothetical protein